MFRKVHMPKTTILLIVDDNRADSDYIITLLKESAPDRFEILVAESISKALGFIAEREIEIITLDLYLPDSSGIGTLLSIRAKAPDIPVVVVSGLDDTKVTKEAMFYGAQAYLVKGEFDGSQLLDAMIKAITRQSKQSLESALKRMLKDISESQNLRQ